MKMVQIILIYVKTILLIKYNKETQFKKEMNMNSIDQFFNFFLI